MPVFRLRPALPGNTEEGHIRSRYILRIPGHGCLHHGGDVVVKTQGYKAESGFVGVKFFFGGFLGP